jgi:hypothetical protein
MWLDVETDWSTSIDRALAHDHGEQQRVGNAGLCSDNRDSGLDLHTSLVLGAGKSHAYIAHHVRYGVSVWASMLFAEAVITNDAGSICTEQLGEIAHAVIVLIIVVLGWARAGVVIRIDLRHGLG